MQSIWWVTVITVLELFALFKRALNVQATEHISPDENGCSFCF